MNEHDDVRTAEDSLAERSGETDALASVVVEYTNEPDECTIFPTNVSREELLTRWISARDGSYVDLEAIR